MVRVGDVPWRGPIGVNRAGAAKGVSVFGRIHVYGVPEAQIKLGLVNKVARIEMGYLTGEVARRVAATARENIHNVTGNLESGTKAEKAAAPYTWEVSSSSMAGDVAGKNNYEYAGYVEFGWGGHHDFPSFAYMTRAYHEHLPDAMEGLRVIGAHLERL